MERYIIKEKEPQFYIVYDSLINIVIAKCHYNLFLAQNICDKKNAKHRKKEGGKVV